MAAVSATLSPSATLACAFVADGSLCARAPIEAKIRREVVAVYIKELETAGFLRRWILWWRIEGEIKRRIRKTAPPEALY
jgi:hypothetical protein